MPPGIRRCGHARNDLPFVVGVVYPCVDYAKGARLRYAILVDPRHADTVRDRDIGARGLRYQALQIIGLESLAYAGMCADPIGDVFLAHGFGAGQWPAKKIAMPQSSIALEVIGLNISPVTIFQ